MAAVGLDKIINLTILAQSELHGFFSEENFIRQNFSFLSFGKVRGSFGITGSDQIGDYQFLNLYHPYVVQIPYQNLSGFFSSGNL